MPSKLYDEAKRRKEELQKAQKVLEKGLSVQLEGRLLVKKCGNSVQYYIRNSTKERCGTYLSKKEKNKIAVYLRKRYCEKALKLVKQELKELEGITKNSKHIQDELRDIYSKSPAEIKSYLTPIDISDEDYINEWLSIPFKGKSINPSMQYFKTDKGELVRSKSELNIANALYKHNIPYKYECPLKLRGNLIIHPDFTVLKVGRRKEVYWEHRGMMDDREYVRHSVERIKEYTKNGIIIGDNLITSEESSVMPLGTNEIESIIRCNFLQ